MSCCHSVRFLVWGILLPLRVSLRVLCCHCLCLMLTLPVPRTAKSLDNLALLPATAAHSFHCYRDSMLRLHCACCACSLLIRNSKSPWHDVASRGWKCISTLEWNPHYNFIRLRKLRCFVQISCQSIFVFKVLEVFITRIFTVCLVNRFGFLENNFSDPCCTC